jgi:hypothetical protein
MARLNCVSVTIDGTVFDAQQATFVASTPITSPGVPEMGALNLSVRVVVDFSDDCNVTFDSIKQLFSLSNTVTRDKVKDMKLELWKDDTKQDVLCSYQFKGWISRFETTANSDAGPSHALILDLQPIINKSLFMDIQMTN